MTQTYKRPPVSAAQRKRILERDDHKCIQCGSVERLEVDHKHELWQLQFIIDEALRKWLASDANCRTLCGECHRHKTRQGTHERVRYRRRVQKPQRRGRAMPGTIRSGWRRTMKGKWVKR